MNIKVWILLCLPIFLLLSACNKEDDTDGDKQVLFHVIISDIEAFNATATITHNGSNRDCYYGFVVKGHVVNPMDEITKLISSPMADAVLASPISQRKHVMKIGGLSPKESFTFIVFGRNTDGQLYGKPAMAEFTTTASNIIASQNTNWTVSYKGHKVYNDWDYSLINVHVDGEVSERFFLCTYEKSKTDTFNNMEDFIFYAVDEFAKLRNSDYDEDFWLDASQVRTESTNFYRYLDPGDYVAFAIGLNADGSPTGHYAKCEPFHVDLYPYTETYAKLINEDWYFEDMNGKIYFVTFKQKYVNRSLTMNGWGNYDEFDVLVNYDRNNGSLKISTQKVTNSDVTIKFSNGDETGTIYLTGAYYNAEDKLKWTSKSHTITTGTQKSNGDYTFKTAYSITLDDGTKATNLGMSFVMRQDGSYKAGFARMMFPFELKRITE